MLVAAGVSFVARTRVNLIGSWLWASAQPVEGRVCMGGGHSGNARGLRMWVWAMRARCRIQGDGDRALGGETEHG